MTASAPVMSIASLAFWGVKISPEMANGTEITFFMLATWV